MTHDLTRAMRQMSAPSAAGGPGGYRAQVPGRAGQAPARRPHGQERAVQVQVVVVTERSVPAESSAATARELSTAGPAPAATAALIGGGG